MILRLKKHFLYYSTKRCKARAFWANLLEKRIAVPYEKWYDIWKNNC